MLRRLPAEQGGPRGGATLWPPTEGKKRGLNRQGNHRGLIVRLLWDSKPACLVQSETLCCAAQSVCTC